MIPDILPPQYKILLSILQDENLTGKKFTDIKKETRLSSATIDKWLKIMIAMGLVVKIDGTYDITKSGADLLKSKLTEIMNVITDTGLAQTIELDTIISQIKLDKTKDEYILTFPHIGLYGEIPVKVTLVRDRRELINKLRTLIQQLESETEG